MPNFVRIKLSNGEERNLSAGESLSHGPTMAKERLDQFSGEWITTLEDTVVNRHQIVEAWLVIDEDHPKHLGQSA